MAYEEQEGSKEYGDLDRLLARYPAKDLVSQIPGQTAAAARTEESKSLRERAAAALVQANPLMVGKSLQDMTRTLVGGSLLPVVAPVSAGIQALNAYPGNLYRRSRGEEEVKTPTTEELMQKYGQAIAPTTQMGRDFEQGLSKAMDVAKVPHAWSLSPPAPRRPILTPTDVRVGAGQVKQLAKELRETPADFQAAQSGLKRQNLYGEDTIGVKAQAAADALGDTLERRKAAGLSAIPGVPQALTPDNKMYAVRPKGTRMVQAKVPESAKGYKPDLDTLGEIVEDVYGDTPAAQMPPEMVMSEYSKRFLGPDSELAAAFKNYMTLRVQEMFPDAPTPRDAQNAYEVLYSNRTERTKQQMAELEKFLTEVVPEYRESAPTPIEFGQRMAEAERVIKGPFTTYLSKNVGAEGDPTVKLARQGITFETPETIQELANLASPTDLAKKRVEAGFPAMGTFYGERLEKTNQLDRLNEEIEALEQARQPLFDRAHEEGIDPASIPEYAETTNPLRQKLRQKELLEADIENIKLAQDVESITDSAVNPSSKQKLLERIPFEQRQFFPSVTKAAEGETLYTGKKSLLKEMGFEKLGQELVEDILTGKAGDTSKLTIENYMREKGLSRIEAEKAAKLQEQKYRENLQNVLLERIRSDQNVKTFGNAAIITLDKNTPTDVAMRDMSADTAVLDHCVGQCGTAPQGRKNILSGKQQYYEPVIDPITGERSSRASGITSYVRDLQNGYQLVSVRDIKTGLPAATLELSPMQDGTSRFRIGYASGAKNGAIDPAYTSAIRDYLNSRAADIYSPGSNLADNAGIFDSTSPAEFRRAAKQAGLTEDQVKAADWYDLPRFVTVDDVKAMAKGMTSAEVAVVEPQRQAGATGAPMPQLSADELLVGYGEQMTQDQREWLTDFSRRWEEDMANFQENGVTRQDRLEAEYNQWLAENRLQADQQAQNLPARRQADLEPIPEDLEARDLLDGYTDRLSPEQIQWLQDWNERFEDANGGARFIEEAANPEAVERLIDEYEGWRRNNTFSADPLANLFDDIEPDNTAVANNPMLQYSPQTRELALRYNIPPVTVREIQAQFADRRMTLEFLNNMAGNALRGASIFESLSQEGRLGAEQMIRDEIGRRAARAQPGQAFDPRDLSMARELLETEREPDGSISQTGIDSTAYALQTGQLDHPLINHIPPGPERARMLEPVLRAFVEQVANERQRAPTPRQAGADLALDYEDLRQGLINDFGDEGVRLVDQNELLDAIRNPIRQGAYYEMPLERRRALADYVQRNGFLDPFQQRLPAQIAERNPVPRNIQTMAIGPLMNDMPPAWNRRAQELADTYFNDNIIDGANVTIGSLTTMLRDYQVGPHAESPAEVRELAARRLESLHTAAQSDAESIADALNTAFYEDMDPQEAADQISRDISMLERGGENTWEDLAGPMAEDIPWNRNLQHHLLGYLRELRERYTDMGPEGGGEGGLPADNPPRRGPFRPGGASAVRGVPLGNLNIQPSIRAESLRGPDSQPIRNFLQQVKSLPGVTQEGLTTGLMAFNNMDPNTRMTKAEFVRELLPSSYDVVDLKNSATDNQHIREIIEEDLIDDQSSVGYLLGLTDDQVDLWSDALAEHGTDFDQYPAKLKRALAKKGIKDADQYNAAYDKAYEAAIQQGVDDYRNYNMVGENEDGYMYADTQRLVKPNMGDEYGEFGVVHPDQRGNYTHYDEAPEGTMGHFRGTYNPADPMTLSTNKELSVETKPGSYVIEEIQSDAQKGKQQKGHLHQVHGILFKAAVQKGLELGADTIYLPTGAVIAKARNEKTSSFAPIYDQAIVKEGLKPLLKIPGVTSKMFHGYHEISFTPEAKEYILNGPGQTIPGYAKGGLVKKPTMALVVTRRNPELAEMAYRYGGMVR